VLSGVGHVRIFLCTEPTDMRKSFDALRGIVGRTMMLDPLSGNLFVFRNKKGDRLKVLWWDLDGLALWYKVLQRGTFQFPDLSSFTSAGVEIDASMLRLILDGLDLSTIKRRDRYRVHQDEAVSHAVAI
jgi:transposase